MGDLYESTIGIGKGGYVVLPTWRDDLGMIPHRARLDVPSLGIADAPCSIMRDGLVRARIPLAAATPANAGPHEAIFTLSYPIVGNITAEDMEPEYELVEAPVILTITDDATLLDPGRHWKDANGLPTPRYLRDKQLFGIPALDADYRLMSDSAFQAAIDAAVQRVETECDIVLGERVFSSIPSWEAPEGATVTDEPGYDYEATRFRLNNGLIRTRKKPVKAVHKFAIFIGGQEVSEIPQSWLQVRPRGDVQIVPSSLDGLSMQMASLIWPILGNQGARPVPQAIRMAYTAGMKADASIFEVVTWIAAQQLLIVISDAQIAGIASQSVSVDGISESVSTTSSATNSTYGANIIELEKRIKAWFTDKAPSYRGIIIRG